MARQPERPPTGPIPVSGRRRKSGAPRRKGEAPTLNVIERARTPVGAASRAANNAQEERRPNEEAGKIDARNGAARKSTPSPAVPDEIRERFIGIGAKYYFPDGAAAFTDHGAKLTTLSENTEVIRSLIAIARAREWGEIKVSGTERFRKEAWFAARLAGLEVRGYRPTEFEQERVVRAIARREAGAADREPSGGSTKQDGEVASRRESSVQSQLNTSRAAEEYSPITGRLVDHGRATYRHDPKEPMSYYVRIETPRGDREIWGVDLERAFRESLSRPTIGDEVTARSDNRDSVTVSTPQRDAAGRVIGKEEIATYRNRWIVERSDFFAERAAAAQIFRDPAISASQGVKQHPELQGSYLQLQAAKLGAERDIRDPEDQARFVARARAAIAQAIERGEALEPVRIRERPARTADAEKSRTPEGSPTR